ncbi:MAG: hypothetical protein AAB480_04245 [Patescibacteria group bacterium]
MNNAFLCVLEDFLNYEPLSQLMQGASMAVLTILISFAIGIFIHHLSDGERKGSSLDLHVALDYVWLFVPSLVIVGIMVTVPFFMGMGGLDFKSIVFAVWLATFLWLFWILLRLYRWVKGDKDDFRLQYLSDFPKSPRDGVVSWRDWWSTKQTSGDRFVEKDFFVAFSKQIDSILGTDDKAQWEILPKLLEGFLSNIGNRNKTFLLVFEEAFPKILEWHYLLWRRQYSKFAKEYTEGTDVIEIHVFEVDRIVDQIIKFITKEALAGKGGNSYSYFKHLGSHIQKHETIFIEGSKHTYHYIEQLPIYSDCLDLIPESPEAYDIWNHYFPASWKITKSNLQNHVPPRIWLHRFLDWARSRVWSEKGEWDKDLDEVSKELFPDVDPIIWAKILAFVMRPWSGSRIQEIIEKSLNFGYIGRIFSGWGDDLEKNFSRHHKEQLANTVDLAVFIFGGIFTEENLNQWLNELNKLEYAKDSDTYKRREHWGEMLKAIKARKEELSAKQQ